MSANRHYAAIALGSNLGDRTANLGLGVVGLASLRSTRVLARGPVIRTPPMLPADEASVAELGGTYFNTAVVVETALPPVDLLSACHAIERSAGRDRSSESRRWLARTLDLDIVLYGETSIDLPGLKIPHEGLRDRPFVLEPLAEIWPEARVPPDGVSIRVLWQALQGCTENVCT
ncbi:MAG: 2-amino-4-hydroxy-6-hydroxymethyldihydropteridine diphosphokinase [Phycisphaeraceae bacterium]|nr:2-amino-4-hydroxy-6-hydroxymethyldihydropteridine diphosphokinase [Phycisphaeraceae bacterium]